jgi:hypothetical protein
VRAHVFLCMLAYDVAWHMRRKLAPLLFEDHDRKAAASRASPVARAQVSAAARAKARRRQTDDGAPAHSFRTLLADLATLTRNTVRFGDSLPMTVLSRPAHPATRIRPPRHRPRAVGRAHPKLVADLSANQKLTPKKPRKFGSHAAQVPFAIFPPSGAASLGLTGLDQST